MRRDWTLQPAEEGQKEDRDNAEALGTTMAEGSEPPAVCVHSI